MSWFPKHPLVPFAASLAVVVVLGSSGCREPDVLIGVYDDPYGRPGDPLESLTSREGQLCRRGITDALACYTGAAGTLNVGSCRAGSQFCDEGIYSACAGEVLPQPELCDGQDNDCNGQTDERVTTVINRGEDQRLDVTTRPVDIVFVIDNSGSMFEEIDSIQRSINNDFASILDRSGIDYRLIMLSAHGDAAKNHAICVQSPLSGNGNCLPPVSACPVNGPRFFQYSFQIGSHESLSQTLTTFDQPDPCGLAPAGWSGWLRPGSVKTFIEFSDDGPAGGNPSQPNSLTAEAFEDRLFALDPKAFGSSTRREFVWHTVAGLHENSPRLSPWRPLDPLVTERCTANGAHVVQPGIEYQKLSQKTAGYRYPICEYQSFNSVFQDLADSVIAQVRMACDFEVAVPGDTSIDNATLSFIPSNAASPTGLTRVAGPSECQGTSYYVEGNRVTLCPAACTMWREDQAARVDTVVVCGGR